MKLHCALAFRTLNKGIDVQIYFSQSQNLNLFKKDAITSWHQKLDDKTPSWICSFIGPMSVLYTEQVAYFVIFFKI